MNGFRRTSRGIHATFSAVEVEVLRHLIDQVLELLVESGPDLHTDDPLALSMGISSSDRLPDDPAVARLLPDAYENPEHAGEFRRYTEHGLREGKVSRLRELQGALADDGRSVLLDDDRAEAAAMAINDLRLTLGVRLEIDDDAEERFAALPDDDAGKGAYAVFAWLGWLQQTLIDALEAR
jgi:hypothetical protein